MTGLTFRVIDWKAVDQFQVRQSGPQVACSLMKMVFFVLGITVVLIGALWIGQGMGFVNWPESSFMIDQRPWVTRGSFVVLFGLVLIAASRRRM